MNYFLALRPTDDTRARLATTADRLQSWNLLARWVHPDDYHVTCSFLGPLDEDDLRGVMWAVEDVASSLLTPTLDLPGLGAFGGRTEPRVVYAAVGDKQGFCTDLHADLQDALGERPEANYRPHITLCRPKPGRRQSQAEVWRTLFEAYGQAVWGPCAVDGLCLYRTDPAAGRRYQECESWSLSARLAG